MKNQSQGTAFIYLIPGLLLLLPAVYVVLLLESTIESESAAMRDNIRDTYQRHLIDASNKLSSNWISIEKNKEMESTDPVNILSESSADSVVMYDKNGKLIFPILPTKSIFFIPPMEASFKEAKKLVESNDLINAINKYIYIYENSRSYREQAMALYEAALLLHKINKKQEALNKLNILIFNEKFKEQLDDKGHYIHLNARVLYLKLEPKDTNTYKDFRDDLVSRLIVYDDNTLLTSQRVFLSEQLREIQPELYFPLEQPEKLALELFSKVKNPDRRNVLQKTLVDELWQYTVNGRTILLYTEDGLEHVMLSLIGVANIPKKASITLLKPNEIKKDSITSINASSRMPGWQISLYFGDPNYMSSLIGQRVKVYKTTALVVIIFSLTLGFLFIRDMRRRLRLADLKNDLVANVTHELKTPLASTRLLLDTLMDRTDLPPDKIKSYLKHLSRENNRLSRLVEHFLAFSKLEKNQYKFQIVNLNLDDLLVELNEAIEGRFPTQKQRIKTSCTDEEIQFRGDIQSLVTVLLNLLENALKFSDESKNVFLNIRKKGKALYFGVKDEGIGISKNSQGKVFNRYYQADERLSRDHDGCGLGLSIVKSVLNAHKSQIQVDSMPGRGSCFYFEILTCSGES